MHAIIFAENIFNELSSQAKKNLRKRQHRNLHADFQEACQRFFNAIEPESYLRPHCHGSQQGAETLIAVKGLFGLVIFDNKGEVAFTHLFGAGRHACEKGVAIGVEVQPGQWHTVVSLEEGSVLLEVKGGPFNPEAPKYFAPWAPDEMTLESGNYLERLRKYFQSI